VPRPPRLGLSRLLGGLARFLVGRLRVSLIRSAFCNFSICSGVMALLVLVNPKQDLLASFAVLGRQAAFQKSG
jgi:hypothetical protein